MVMENAHAEQTTLLKVAPALSDLADLTLRAVGVSDQHAGNIAENLLDRLMRLTGAPRGGLVVESEEDVAVAAHLRPLALSHLTTQDIEALHRGPLHEPSGKLARHDNYGWLQYELPLQATSGPESALAIGSRRSYAVVILGWPMQAAKPSAQDAVVLLNAVAGAAGAVIAALLLARRAHDATVSDRAGSASAETDTTWEQVFDAVSDPMCVITADYQLERANAAYIQMFGLNRHGIPGHECFSLHPGQTEPCANCPLPDTIRTGQAAFVQQERLIPRNDGAFERRIFQRWTYPIFRPDGTVGRIVEILKDVTDQEQARTALSQAEALREADRLKSELLGTVSHELRSPLTTIKGYAATLLRHERRLPREERHEFLTAIVEASNALQVIIDRLLEMSQIETGALRVERVDINLRELARAALNDIERANRESTRRFDFQLTCDPPDTERSESQWEVEGDHRLLRDLLDNLLENAVKYSPTGGRIEVGLHTRAGATLAPIGSAATLVNPIPTRVGPSRRSIELVVSDMGMGIPQEHLEHIFERFHRVDTRLTREVGGLGLGLAICQRIVERHGGIIWAESVPDKGSAFHVQLPAADDTPDDAE